MQTFGLIGYPLIHSFSRSFFTEKFEREHIDACYLNFEIPSIEEFPNVIQNNPHLVGLNVTIPYKQKVIPFLDELSDEAREIGAVNVIKVDHRSDGVHLKGYNADVVGFVRSISPLLTPAHNKALILGTGGASLAVDYGLRKMGLGTVFVSRTPKEGMLAYTNLTPQLMNEYRVVVNCTPCGMYPHVNESPSIPYEALGPQHVLYDLVYNPEETQFLSRGRQQGAVTKNGLEMLHLQALAGWEIWNNSSGGL